MPPPTQNRIPGQGCFSVNVWRSLSTESQGTKQNAHDLLGIKDADTPSLMSLAWCMNVRRSGNSGRCNQTAVDLQTHLSFHIGFRVPRQSLVRNWEAQLWIVAVANTLDSNLLSAIQIKQEDGEALKNENKLHPLWIGCALLFIFIVGHPFPCWWLVFFFRDLKLSLESLLTAFLQAWFFSIIAHFPYSSKVKSSAWQLYNCVHPLDELEAPAMIWPWSDLLALSLTSICCKLVP